MRICADENVSPVLSKLIRESLLSKQHTLETVDDHQAVGVDDEIWVRKFAKAGGEAIVGADSKMMTRPNEVIAIAETGVRLIVLPSQWVQQKRHLQISYLFFWWPQIEATLVGAKPMACFKMPWAWSATSKIEPWKLDVQGAYRKAKR